MEYLSDVYQAKIISMVDGVTDVASCICFTHDGRQALMGSVTGRSITIIDVWANKVVKHLTIEGSPSDGGPWAMAVAPNDKTAIAISDENFVYFIDLEKFSIAGKIPAGKYLTDVVFGADGKMAYLVSSGDASFYIIDVVNTKVDDAISNLGIKPDDVVLSNDGRHAFISYHGNVFGGGGG